MDTRARTTIARHAAFLRGINLGKRRLTMDQLRAAFEGFGLKDVATFIASGNVVFEHRGADTARLERDLEAHLADALGLPAATFVRSFAELARLVAVDAVADARDAGFNIHAVLLRERPGADARAALDRLEGADDRFTAHEREVLWLRRGRMSDAPFSTRDLERALGADQTVRNLNTVERMVKKFGER